MKLIRTAGCLLLTLTGITYAQTIRDVTNAGSRLSSGFPGYGLAQGAIFAVTGTNVGSDPLQQASFPLPTTDGLGGVTIQASVGGTTVDCIMVYVSANEVGAILPSGTPTGTGTLTINNNGATATANITVVPAAFGIFTQSQTGSGAAEAFNVAPDGTATLNTLTAPASSGQTMMLNGTGLGAITSDETQSGVTDTPGATPQVWVGLQQATVVSASRGNCCSGIDPSFEVPAGVAGWDVIQFVVPNGITGCHVPVAVQVGQTVSNFSTISVSNGGACTDPGGFGGGALQNLSGSSAKMGSISLSRSSTKLSAGGFSISTNNDSGNASFSQYDLTQYQALANPNLTALGSCYVLNTTLSPGQIPNVTLPTGLNAGGAINVKGPNGTKQMTPSQGGSLGSYSGMFGNSQSGLPITPPGQTPPFLEAGSYTIDNGAGGSDVGPFTATLTLKTPLNWVNQDQITAVTRSQGVQVSWSGGDPSSLVVIFGLSANTVNGVNYTGAFTCIAPVSAGQFTVPPIVTLSLPASAPQSGPAAVPTGFLNVGSSVSGTFTAPGIDVGTISSTVSATKNVSYQ